MRYQRLSRLSVFQNRGFDRFVSIVHLDRCSDQAIVRPWRLETVVKALFAGGVRGLTATSVSGVGSQSGNLERYAGREFGSDVLVEKKRLDIVCERAQIDDIVHIIIEAARTGEVGDGKIFVHPIADVVRMCLFPYLVLDAMPFSV